MPKQSGSWDLLNKVSSICNETVSHTLLECYVKSQTVIKCQSLIHWIPTNNMGSSYSVRSYQPQVYRVRALFGHGARR